MKTYVIGDIHGCHKGLKQCLERSNFDYENDTLITLGDICDGWSEVYECVEELLKIKNRIDIVGNHDKWFTEFLEFGIHPDGWTQGGEGTFKSYMKFIKAPLYEQKMSGRWSVNLIPEDVPETHHKFFREQLNYFIDEDNNCFVHGGFNRYLQIKGQSPDYIYYWDRELWNSALSAQVSKHKLNDVNEFKEIFIGHTSTTSWGKDTPMNCAQVWNLDTGGGWNGKVTIMNVDNKEYFQSDNVKDLYPNERGR